MLLLPRYLKQPIRPEARNGETPAVFLVNRVGVAGAVAPILALRGALIDELARYEMSLCDLSALKEGDRVCFSYTAGQQMQVGDEAFLVLQEDACEAVWNPDRSEVVA